MQKSLIVKTFIAFFIVSVVSCIKSEIQPNVTLNERETTLQDTTYLVRDTTPTARDSSQLMLGRWKYTKDSSTNDFYSYRDEDGIWGSPMPGVYIGTESDFFEFQSNGFTAWHGNKQYYTSTYKLYPNNKLVITGMLAHDTATIVKLTATEFVFNWSKTSANGGKYFRRAYLNK